ncbi:MAG TPA: ribosome maturation factor RimP [Streptosporangiaceae bacterium]
MNGDSRHNQSRPQAGSADTDRIVSLLEPAVAAMGMDLENVRITSAGRRRLLRVVVDADGGVSLDDIAQVSREVSATLDRAAAMGEAAYTLEVSSPGVDRPLTEPKHWRRAVGRLVTAPLREPVERDGDRGGPATVTGRVTGADDRGVRLDVRGVSREFGYSELGPGKIQVEFAQLDDGADLGADEEGPDGH